jgi:hypothetical protein
MAGFLVLTGLVVGCGSGRGELTGKVIYNGKPVPGGNIKLTINGTDFVSGLSSDGTYEFYDLTPGQAVLTIDNENLNPDKKRPEYGDKGKGMGKMMAKMANERMKYEGRAASGVSGNDLSPELKAEMAKRYVKIPVKYTNTQTSDAKVLIKAGRNEHDFVLKD